MSAGSVLSEIHTPAQLREQAWVGDAVLGLFARQWILANSTAAEDRSELFRRMTCNQFLSALGEPTRVEARIGRIYERDGLEKAFAFINDEILPLYLRQAQKRQRSERKTVRK